MRCRQDHQICSLSPLNVDHDVSANTHAPTLSSDEKSSKRRFSTDPELKMRPQSKMKKTSKGPPTSSKYGNASSKSRPQPFSEEKTCVSSKPEPSTSSKLEMHILSSHLELEEIRSQLRVLSHRVSEVEEARIRERAAYSQSLKDLAPRLDNFERSGEDSEE
jgi:hypothetical protein